MRAGDRIGGRFEIDRLAGSGGMGEVYRALDAASSGFAAIKVVRAAGPELSERFDQEARVLARLEHPAIVRYLAHGTTGAHEQFLAMEWLEGEDLGTRLERGPLAPAEALALVSTVAEALGFAHNFGVVHRDVKPSNLFLVGGIFVR